MQVWRCRTATTWRCARAGPAGRPYWPAGERRCRRSSASRSEEDRHGDPLAAPQVFYCQRHALIGYSAMHLAVEFRLQAEAVTVRGASTLASARCVHAFTLDLEGLLAARQTTGCTRCVALYDRPLTAPDRGGRPAHHRYGRDAGDVTSVPPTGNDETWWWTPQPRHLGAEAHDPARRQHGACHRDVVPPDNGSFAMSRAEPASITLSASDERGPGRLQPAKAPRPSAATHQDPRRPQPRDHAKTRRTCDEYPKGGTGLPDGRAPPIPPSDTAASVRRKQRRHRASRKPPAPAIRKADRAARARGQCLARSCDRQIAGRQHTMTIPNPKRKTA